MKKQVALKIHAHPYELNRYFRLGWTISESQAQQALILEGDDSCELPPERPVGIEIPPEADADRAS